MRFCLHTNTDLLPRYLSFVYHEVLTILRLMMSTLTL